MLATKNDRYRTKLNPNWQFHLVIFIVAVAIVVSRRPDAVFNPQFWAEDGAVWYADAYNFGIVHSLFLPYAGYLNTIARLTASLAQLFPLALAPLIFNLTAIALQVLPANLVASSRFATLIPSFPARLLLAFVYLARPNSFEVNATISSAQWHLALLACMVILAAPSQHLGWRLFDLGVVLLSAFSGPFSILLIPIAVLRWWWQRQRWLLVLLLCLVSGAVVQGLNLINTPRPPATLGATPQLFAKIFAGQVMLGSLVGQEGYTWLITHNLWSSSLAILLSVIGLSMLVYALCTAPLELRLFIIFASFISITALVSPAASSTVPQWQVMWLPGVGCRYWLIPMFAFLMTLLWLLSLKQRLLQRSAAIAVAILVFIGIRLDWHYPPYTDFNFPEHASQFTSSPQGTQVIIPINPPGWTMAITRR